MSDTAIEFLWDISSSYSYLASTQIDAVGVRHRIDVIWRPVLIGALFKHTGNVSPATVPAKAMYIMQDMQRWADYYDIPFRGLPSSFPINSLLPLRAVIAAQQVSDEKAVALSKALFHSHWVDDQDPSQADVLCALCEDVGLDGAKILAQTQNPMIKEQLKQNTNDAIERGVFGCPSFFVGDTLFWGNDRLPLLEHFLNHQR